MGHETDSPQVKDSPRADAEWKADPGLSNLVHGSDGSVSPATPPQCHDLGANRYIRARAHVRRRTRHYLTTKPTRKKLRVARVQAAKAGLEAGRGL